MSNNIYAKIPSASEFLKRRQVQASPNVSESDAKKGVPKNNDNVAKLTKASEQYTKDMVELVDTIIRNEFLENEERGDRLKDYAVFSLGYDPWERVVDIPWHVVHYGHFAGQKGRRHHWTKRNTLEIDMPFRQIQKAFASKEWFLYEISDPERSHDVMFLLHAGRPKIQNEGRGHLNYLNKDLWHNYNIIPE